MMSTQRRLLLLLLSLLAALFVCANGLAAESAKALESRLYAPCCYGGTLDIHDSELAHDLRKEIETRLANGESSDAIQADFVARYGDKVIAASSDKPSEMIGGAMVAFVIVAGAALRVAYRRWMKRSAVTGDVLPASKKSDELDARVDQELADLDQSA